MLNKIQTKIDSLAQGKKLILGTGIQLDEMQKVVALCEELQSSGQIKIVRVNKDPNKAQGLATGIVLEKN
ncbi:hypothetical protein G9F31_06965 [Acinetobacter sp. 187]|uniref:Uncharacterized protein n=1 Tax=Acinetobacter lanii TaxID=2715163 RepID=A0A6G8S1M3_9GAMM|nr:hypothetical protein [Acinetobacter lanii]NHC03510.1 hypothetical protein [Acinetobacter lanii]QIO08031.1 hypothetical protein G8D99_02680 [Acinetobacter lanii]